MIQPGSKVYIKRWGYGNDPEEPVTVISVDRLLRINVSVPKRECPGSFMIKGFRLDELLEMHQPRKGGNWYPVKGWRRY